MKLYIFFILCFLQLNSFADRFIILCEFNARSVDSIGFSINGRPVKSSMIGVGSYNSVGPFSECFKSGSNVLCVAVVERKPDSMPSLEENNEIASVKFLLRRYNDYDKLADEILITDETFNTIPTNFVFTVPSQWPIKNLIWEGNTPVINDNDKTEITGILQSVADAYSSIDKTASVKKLLMLEKYVNKQEAILQGITLSEMEEDEIESLRELSKELKKDKIYFNDVKVQAMPGINLVKVSIENKNFPTRTSPFVAYMKNGSAPLIGPEWFSKIDGKWWIVP